MADLPNNQDCPVLKLSAAKYISNTHIPSTAMYAFKKAIKAKADWPYN